LVTYEAFEELRNGVYYDYSVTDDYLAQTRGDHISKRLKRLSQVMEIVLCKRMNTCTALGDR
jgi:hypothetical protein